MRPMRRLPCCRALAALLPVLAGAGDLRPGQDEAQLRIELADRIFLAARNDKEAIPQAPVQAWVELQQIFADLEPLARDPGVPLETRLRALYVQGFGLSVVELYDLAAVTQRQALDEAPPSWRPGLLADLATTHEAMGDFAAAAGLRTWLLQELGDRASRTQLNNAALTYLKNGQYELCLAAVERIELERESAHTQLFAARALAWRGEHAEAAARLSEAASHGSAEARRLLDELAARPAANVWTEDLEASHARWSPKNQVAGADLAPPGPLPASRYAPLPWLDEVYRLYPGREAGDLRPAVPESVRPAQYAVVLVAGVPFLALFPMGDPPAVRGRLQAYVRSMHTPSIWRGRQPEANRVLLGTLDGRPVGIVAHAGWQEELVRTRLPAADWEAL
jgi:hypothetical protein